MPIIDKQLVSEYDDPSRYKPSVTCQSVVQKIRENIALHGDAVWMANLTTGKSISYAELARIIDQTSFSLRRRGFRPCDVVAIMATNHLEVPIIFFAAWKAGGGCSALNVGLFVEDIRSRIIETRANFIVTDEQRADKVLQAIQGLNMQSFVIGQAEGHTPVDQLLQDDGQDGEQYLQFDMDPPAWLTYSSGTTGKAKGILHTHYSLSPYVQPSDKALESEMVGQKFMFNHSMIHGTGLFSFMRSTVDHRNTFTFSNANLEALLQGIHSIKPSCISIFPYEMAEICLHPQLDRYDLTSVETIIYSGCANLPLFERQIFGKMQNLRNLISMYGMSETMLITLDNPKPRTNSTMDRNKIIKSHLVGCAGKVLPFVKLKIIDPNDGNKLGPNEIGEIVVHTPFLMKGYLNQTKKWHSNGWFNTGDQGYYDAEGHLFVIGYKELIKYKSRQVAPSNIEAQLMTHSAVKDVAVVGLPHGVDGEHPLAYVVIKMDDQGRPLVTAKELIDYTNKRVVDEEQLRGGVRFIEHIPRNKFGKVVRHQLVANLKREEASSRSS
ncbi:uncharacterized protein LOC130688491 [Daphnia carinata]|uniref:uncharacterized protein LOC130688491 n=1 Tax=Daphnia carinata TaxID=120202 RepID=UPI00286980E5|nr:uncharacterized protein LOC130688491 [Daphnia carinata]